MKVVREVAEVVGLCCITAAAALVAPWAGLAVGGACLVLVANFTGRKPPADRLADQLAKRRNAA